LATQDLAELGRDCLELLRDGRHVLTRISTYKLWGALRIDAPLHLFGAAALYLVARRYWSRLTAALVTCAALLVKELADVFIKSSASHVSGPTYDTLTDLAFGVAGLGLGMLAARLLGERLRHRRRREPSPPPAPREVALSERASFGLHLAFGVFCAALLVGHLVLGGKWAWHLPLGAAVLLACRFFGPAAVTMVAIPAVPYLNGLYRVLDVHGPHLYASDTLVLTLALYVLTARLARREVTLRWHAADPLVLLYAAFGVLAVLWGLPEGGLTFPKAKQLLCVAEGLAVYFLVVNLFRTPGQLRRAAWVLALSAGLACVIAAVELFTRSDVLLQVHPGGLYKKAERFSAYVTMMAPLTLGLAVFVRGWRRWPFAACAVLGLAMVAITASRSGWASGAVSATLVLLFACWRKDWVLALAVLAVLAAVGGVASATLERAASRRRADIREAAGRRAPRTYNTRVMRELLSVRPAALLRTFRGARGAITERGLREIRERPLLGHAGTEVNRTSIYLNLAVDNGLIAASALLVMIGWVIVRGLRLGGRVRDPLLRALAFGCAFGLIGSLIEGVGVGWPVRRMFVPLFWYLLALGPAAIAASGAAAASRPRARGPLLLLVAVGALVVLARILI